MSRSRLTAPSILLAASIPAAADDWPQFQGPRGNGTPDELICYDGVSR